jgi:DNA-binding GntR family transcriptional regulator
VIRQHILDGNSSPGERLPIERLARQINMSVVPVREAIRRLEAEGFVTFTRNVGATVASIDLERYPETIEAVAVLEGVATGLAAPHITATDLKKARALNDDMRRSIAKLDPVRFTRTNARFHKTLYVRCPNRHIVGMVEREWALLETTRRSAFSLIPERATRSVDEHDELLRLITEGHPGEEVEAFARRHRMRTARALLQHLGDQMEAAELAT